MNMIEIFEMFQDYLEQENIRYFEAENCLQWYLSSENRLGFLRCTLQNEANECTLYIYLPVKANRCIQSEMLKIAEFVTRVNFGLSNGNFELDWTNGEVSFRYSIKHSDTYAGVIIQDALSIISAYETPFLSAMFGNANVKECLNDYTITEKVVENFNDDDMPPDWGKHIDNDTNEAELYVDDDDDINDNN